MINFHRLAAGGWISLKDYLNTDIINSFGTLEASADDCPVVLKNKAFCMIVLIKRIFRKVDGPMEMWIFMQQIISHCFLPVWCIGSVFWWLAVWISVVPWILRISLAANILKMINFHRLTAGGSISLKDYLNIDIKNSFGTLEASANDCPVVLNKKAFCMIVLIKRIYRKVDRPMEMWIFMQ